MAKKLHLMLAALMATSLINTAPVLAGAKGTVVQASSNSNGNLTYATYVSNDMCKPDYWKKKLGSNADKVLMTSKEIEALNKKILQEKQTYMTDIEKMSDTYEANPKEREIPTQNYYIDGKLIDNNEYFGKINKAMVETGYYGQTKTQYAVVTERVDLKDWPTTDIVGYSADDTDDELQSSAMNVNEPFVIRQKCEIDGKTYYNGTTFNCSGWVDGDCIAICSSKEEWIDSWKVNPNSKDFIVLTQSRLTLEPSTYVPSISNVDIMLGTTLKLVPQKDMPVTVAERGTWNNYVVYLPTRNEKGNYVKQKALIPQRADVSIGYLPLTQGNVLDVAFSCLGDRYGWGGMLGAMDCSMYAVQIYRCFGINIPRNTSWQSKIPERSKLISNMSDEEKLKYFETLPVGSLLMMQGHITVFVGMEAGRAYVISDSGTLADSEGDLTFIGQMSVILNPLNVRRKSGNTWLSDMKYAIRFDGK
ncbi:MAG: C40 family peptidase [Firmicutes bacterium]|nr:C40 family peptidase [Bacillota bacterium]